MKQDPLIIMSSNSILHTVEKIGFSEDCYYYQNGCEKPKKVKNATFKCKTCRVPISKPTKSECWDLHIMRGLLRKWYLRK